MFESLLESQGCGRQFQVDIRGLGEPDAVLPGKAAPEAAHQGKQIFRGRVGGFPLTGLTLVEHDIHMDVAIPGVAEADDGQVPLPGDVLGSGHQEGNGPQGHGHVPGQFGQSRDALGIISRISMIY